MERREKRIKFNLVAVQILRYQKFVIFQSTATPLLSIGYQQRIPTPFDNVIHNKNTPLSFIDNLSDVD